MTAALVHPNPSFFETTTVRIGKTVYTHVDYLSQRERTFGRIEDLKEAAYVRMLDSGWVPTMLGCLAEAPNGLLPGFALDQRETKQVADLIKRGEVIGPDLDVYDEFVAGDEEGRSE